LILTLLPLAVSYFRIFRLPKTPATGLPLSIWEQIQKGRKKSPQLNFTPSPSAPFSSGILLPKVLIPSESQEWTHGRLNSCLLHEAAHLKNHDPLTRAISAVIRAIFWFHPLVWYAHRELIQAQEQICDQHALRNGIEPENYAEDLLAAASHSHLTPSEALSMAKWSQIGNRIRYILHPSALKSVTAGQMRTLFGLLLAIPLTLASIGFASEKEEDNKTKTAFKTENTPAFELLSRSENKATILSSKEAQTQEFVDFINKLRDEGITKLTITTPKELKKERSRLGLEKATALVLIHPETNMLQSDSPLTFKDFMNDELQYIVADETLALSVNTIRNDFDSDNDTIAFLRTHISATQRRGTNLIEITAYHKDLDKAVQIANSIANSYLTRRNNDEKQRRKSALAIITKNLVKYESAVTEKREKLITLLKEHGIPHENKPLKESEFKKRLLSKSDNEVENSLIENLYNSASKDYEMAKNILHEMKIKHQNERVRIKTLHRAVTIHEMAR